MFSLVFRTTIGRIEAEREMLKEQENEIAEMKTQLERMRREKEDAQSKYAVLQEKLRQVKDQRRAQRNLMSTRSSQINLFQEALRPA